MKEIRKIYKMSLVLTISLLLTGFLACSGNSRELITKEIPLSGKPVAPVSISYTVPEKADVGESITVTVSFKLLSDAEKVTLKLTPDKGMEITSGKTEVDYGDQLANSAFSESVTIVPHTEGVLYLNVFVTGTFGGRKMARTGAVPVYVGTDIRKMMKNSGKTVTDSTGKKIIIMPAEEKKELSE